MIIVILLGVILGLVLYVGVNELNKERRAIMEETAEVEIWAQVIDEDNRGQISTRTKAYIAQLEKDLEDLGYIVTKVTLPTGVSRELYVDLEGRTEYFKVSLDRETALTAEDIDRMVRYLEKMKWSRSMSMCGSRRKRIISSMNDGVRAEGLILFQFGFCSGFRNDEKLDASEVYGDSGRYMFISGFVRFLRDLAKKTKFRRIFRGGGRGLDAWWIIWYGIVVMVRFIDSMS